MKYFFICIFTLFSFKSYNGVQFLPIGLDNAIKIAQKENKLIYLNLYASWCGWCKHLKNKTLTNKEVANYFNEKFVSITLNGEKGEGRKLRDKFKITAYPANLFLTKDGQIIKGQLGYLKPQEILSVAKSVFTTK